MLVRRYFFSQHGIHHERMHLQGARTPKALCMLSFLYLLVILLYEDINNIDSAVRDLCGNCGNCGSEDKKICLILIPKKVVILYSGEDAKYKDELRTHLIPYEKKNIIEVWDNTNILPGAVRHQEHEEAINSTEFAILLVNAQFIASSFVEEEVPDLLARREQKGAIILQVITGSCSFQETELADFQTINDFRKPVSKLKKPERGDLWEEVARYIKNTTIPLQAEERRTSSMDRSEKQPAPINKIFARFLYRDDSMVDNLLSQLNIDINSFTCDNKFVWLYTALSRQNILQRTVRFNQVFYDTIQPGQIIELRGKMRISQWETLTDMLVDLGNMNEMIKSVTGQDMIKMSMQDKKRKKRMKVLHNLQS